LSESSLIPHGCVSQSLDSECQLFLLVKGCINVEEECKKLKDKIDSSKSGLDQLKKQIEMPDYETKIKTDIRDANATKLKSLEVEIETLCVTLEKLKSL
jgi:valyl-tRNA synthetase